MVRWFPELTSRGYPFHHGPYETLSESYGLIFDHSKSIGIKINYPIREITLRDRG